MRTYSHFEGLRGVAAFIVFLAHFRPTFCTDINERVLDHIGIMDLKLRAISQNFISLLYEGTLPVFIFWLMSAYVISIKLFDVRRNENNMYLVEASTKRYFRLAIPVFVSSFFCYVLLKAGLIFNHQLAVKLGPGYDGAWLSYWYNFSPSFMHFLKTSTIQVFLPGNSNYNIALWTMNAEFLGSFLCFGLFAVIGKNRFRFVIYLISILFLVVGGSLDFVYFYYLVFVFGIMWCDASHSEDEGVYLRQIVRNFFKSKSAVMLLLLLGFGGTIFSDVIYPLHEKLYYFFNFPVKALALTLLVNNFVAMRKLFSVRPLLFLGKISFSFYLLHQPIMFSLGIYMYLYAGLPDENKLWIIFGTLVVVNIVLSYVFMRLIDMKSIVVSDKIGKYFSAGQKKNGA